MKNVVKLLVVLIAVTFSTTVNAQTNKVAHINLQELISLMPEAKKAQADLDTMQAAVMREMTKKEDELKRKFDQYKADVASGTMLPSIQSSREDELRNLQDAYQKFGTAAEDDLQKRRLDLYNPIIKKATDAVKDIAKEKGYSYVMDSSAGTMLYSSDTDNLMPAVKAKLLIK